MGVPTPAKTWQTPQHIVNGAQASALAQNQHDLRSLITALLAFGTLPCTVDYSCDSVTAGTKGDGVNRWSADSKLVWTSSTGTGVRSWIVLNLPSGFGAGAQMCIHCFDNGGSMTTVSSGLEVAISPSAGFAGGTTSARPTAADEFVPESSTSGAIQAGATTGPWADNLTAARLSIWHVLQPTDGSAIYAFLATGGHIVSEWLLAKLQSPVSGMTHPIVASIHGSASSTVDFPTYANLSGAAGMIGCGAPNATSYAAYLTGEGIQLASSNIGGRMSFANDFSAEWPMEPVGVYSETSLCRGRHGYMPDLWWGSTSAASGDTYPNDATKQFSQVGNLIVVGDGTTWQMS